ncbi:PREDICTED: nuclear transcription factor Y subunit B-9-like [Erythranthe guttata]|uniref:nuclear transcription factor Y subunit B-9-like n=1 Tax=Erythranthe guttata TaxID=4155 RepID=UPI00064D7A1E|nr:PREDICTED: nuclear transcription factor Y subunit B-9-like [Erythranthe guttata]|eukprot:XP_012858173.1 PREDICTED: nuclear transcription factor Y subunit B-9-like [Erythranthe guttata]
MEIGGNSNAQHKDTTGASASASGTIDPNSVAPNLPTSNVGDQNQAPPQDFRRETDLYMPMTNIVRVLRRALPPHAKISDDAKEIIQECVSEFISIVTSEANEKAHREYRKTIHPEDVIAAMSSLGFDDYVEPLTVYLNKYRAEDPERGASMQIQLPMAVPSGAQQPPAAVVAPPVPPPPLAPLVVMGDGMVIVDDDEVVGPDEYIGFDEVIRKYFLND